ncbi:MAG: SH3 domain-containing protein, partial [Acetatifactor sp.]
MEIREKVKAKLKVLVGMFALALVLGLSADPFSIVSQASQGKITASTTAKIRKEASTSSDSLGSVPKDKVVTINGQVQASDGYVWYQVSVDGINGYIRSDLVELIDGNTPADEGTSTEVTVVNPISATVHGNTTGTSVRVRKEASTSSSIVANAVDGQALTVIGTANGNDGKVWYQVKFNTGGTDVTGFIRSDYVKLSGDLTTPAPENNTPIEDTPTVQEPEVETIKEFETKEVDGIWYLIDNKNRQQYGIQADLFDKVTQNADAYNVAAKKVKSQKTIITILVLLLLAAAAFIGLLIIKLKGAGDDMYYRPAERDAVRRRMADRPQSSERRPATKAEYGKPLGASGISGQRPGTNGTRPAGQSGGARPAGQPAGARPAGQPAGARPAGQPAGARPAGQPAGARPVGQPAGARPAGQPAGARPA